MKPSHPPAPSQPSQHSTLLLQRRLSSGDCNKWRTVLAFTHSQAQAVVSLVAAAQQIDAAVTWRVCRDAPTTTD